MKGMPIPESRWGWVTVVSLTVVAFALYYLVLFPHLMQFYERDLYIGQSTDPELVSSSCSDEARQALDRLIIRVKSPWHVAPFVRRWISVTIRNDGELPVENVEWWLDIYPQGRMAAINSPVLPFLFDESNTLQTSVHFTQIAPYATVTGRAPVFVASSAEGSVGGPMWIRVQDCIAKIRVVGDELPLLNNNTRSLAHSLVENLLLPPWSNGLLVAVVFVASYIAEKDAEDKENKQQCLGLVVFLNALRYLIATWALVLFLVFIAWNSPLLLLLLFLSMPLLFKDKIQRWLHEKQKKLPVKHIILFVVFVALICYGFWGTRLPSQWLRAHISLLIIALLLSVVWVLLGKVSDKSSPESDSKTGATDNKPTGGESDV